MPSGDAVQPGSSLQSSSVRDALKAYFRRRVRDANEVEDLVQDVFMRVAGRAGGDRIDNLGGYIFRTAASVLADRARRRTARSTALHIAFDPDIHSGADFDPQQLLSDREDLRAAITALLSLPERTRVIFVLHRLEGYGYREIGAQLGISVSAVEKHMARAVRHLMKVGPRS
jgi:RNA polymerase sigma-70 factor (ECF subfamily)